jgi:tetratricopeptide (TPR) repeat protein
MTVMPDADALAALLNRGLAALSSGRIEEAAACCKRALAAAPRAPQAHFLVGLVATERRDWRTAVEAFGSVTRLEPTHAAAWAQLARAWVNAGFLEPAQTAIERALAVGSEDPVVLDLVGVVQSLLGDQVAALTRFDAACRIRPHHPPFELNRANALTFLGRIDEAEAALARVFAVDAEHPQAHWLAASLRRAADRAHVQALEALIERHAQVPQAIAFYAYAAGKKYEDLGDWTAAFAAYARGAAARRRTIEFDEAAEIALFEALTETFTAAWIAAAAPGDPDPAPIFVVGQPRTGTTLIERVLTSHSQVHAAGELQQFRLAVRRLCGIATKERFSAAMARAAARIEPRRLGSAYLAGCAVVRGERRRFVDKMPTNFLFVPLIAAALPNARIVHVTRHPADSCFASFKQLFADAYPHSYDLLELARHHVRYRRLMDAWRARLPPGRLIEVSYEDAAADLEPTARTLVDALGLPWEDACLEFHRQDRAVTTASAVQVREPAHTRSVGRFRRYEHELAPALAVLRDAGLLD